MGSDIFCTLYGRWKEGGQIIFENDHAYSLLSVTPAVPGHSTVISKTHVSRIEELRGAALEGFVDAWAATNEAVRTLYDNPERIVAFYESLRANPPAPTSAADAQLTLAHPHLRIKPDPIAHNPMMNVGGYAGQSVDHLHVQIMPCRQKRLGVVAMARRFFNE